MLERDLVQILDFLKSLGRTSSFLRTALSLRGRLTTHTECRRVVTRVRTPFAINGAG